MELPIGAISYGFAALAFAVLTGLLALSRRDKFHGFLLVLAAGVSCVWAALTAYTLIRDTYSVFPELLEIARDGLWLLLLWKIFESGGSQAPGQPQAVMRHAFI